MALTLPFTALPRVEVFALDSHAAQIAWRNLPSGLLRAVVDGSETILGEAGQPGVCDIEGLNASAEHKADMYVDRVLIDRIMIRTPPALPGPVITRIATISDLHLGENAFGLTRTMHDKHGDDPYPLRCALAAVREAQAWGAEMIVFKGDITDSGQSEQWDQFDQVLDKIDIPVMAVPGNHDTVEIRGSIDHHRARENRGLDSHDVQVHDRGDVRIVAVDSTIATKGSGTLVGRTSELLSAIDTHRRVVVFTHHHFEHTPVRYFWPPGISATETTQVLRAIAEVNPAILISSGHTHRCRSRTSGATLITEVGSVKDHPGVWAGYEIHPTGIRQVVRRVADPSCLQWTERTSHAVGGIWGRWSPGRIEQRSVSHVWPSTGELVAGIFEHAAPKRAPASLNPRR